MRKRGQISVEYLMLIAISMMIIIPGVYFFRSYVFESNDRILEGRLSDISGTMLSKADKMYYYGKPSRTVVSIDMPPKVENMFILQIPSDPANGYFYDEYFLGIQAYTTRGLETYLYDSDISLQAGENVSCNLDECQGRHCMCFPRSYYTEGHHDYSVVAAENCYYDTNCVNITLAGG